MRARHGVVAMTNGLALRSLTTVICLLLIACTANVQETTRPNFQILMVCEHGNAKSLMAASYFNELAKARHSPFRAVSRGTVPDSTTVPSAIVDGLRTDGFDVSEFHPTAITSADVAASYRVILINTE